MAIFQRSLQATAAAAIFTALAMPAAWAASNTATDKPTAANAEIAQRPEQAQQKMHKLEQALQLSQAQQSHWTSYREALAAIPRLKPLEHESFAQLTTPQRIDQMRELRAQRNAAVQLRDQATKAFYASLTPTQQKTFDSQTLLRGEHRHGHHRKAHDFATPQ